MRQDIFDKLEKRIGKDHLQKRLEKQVNIAAKFYAKGGYTSIHPENAEWIADVLKMILKGIGHYDQAVKNTLDYRILTNLISFEKLPDEFNGYKILHLSDIHADGIPDNGRKLVSILKNISADICLITGDYRFETQDVYHKSMENMYKIAEAVDVPMLGVLGNHDFIEFIPYLEEMGIRILLNESVYIQKNNAGIWISGIDDAHIYACHDIEKAKKDIPAGDFKIMLSHTPETYEEVASAGYDFMLSGHTHAGQVCLPGGIPIITNAKCPYQYKRGEWRFKRLKGYTTRCVGASGLSVRMFCPPEISIHVLKKQ